MNIPLSPLDFIPLTLRNADNLRTRNNVEYSLSWLLIIPIINKISIASC